MLGGDTRPARGRFCRGCGRVFSQKDVGKDQLPRAEGRGEGELDRRTVAAGQNVFGTRETEHQILAALDILVRWGWLWIDHRTRADRNVRAPIIRAKTL